jgi:hypothetical protein
MFRSSDELFQATNELLAMFENNGALSATEELKSGLGALNGLTDGWALFLESVKKVEKEYASQLSDTQKSLLTAIHEAAYEAVYRRSMKPWWRLW